MNDWRSVCASSSASLSKGLEVAQHAMNLAKMPGARSQPKTCESLSDLIIKAKRFKSRLDKGVFRIAVVGLEKAGKSTFINAWLDCELLPADSSRCTYTTTHLHSVQADSEQCICVTTRTQAEFDQLCAELSAEAEKTTEEGQRARQDLETISRHKSTLMDVIREGESSGHVITIPFARLDDIRDDLRKFIANVKYAHAVSQVALYTHKLAAVDGVVFSDVPGLNSGLSKHIEESRTMLADSDAVILIQNSATPSIEANEQKLLRFIREGDDSIDVRGKLFVFFGKIDRLGSHEALKENLDAARDDWSRRGELPEDRIIAGSAGAHLVLSGVAGDMTRKHVGDSDTVEKLLRNVTNDFDSGSVELSGIGRLKKQLAKYLDVERSKHVRHRCNDIRDRIKNLSKDIYGDVAQHCPENPDEVKKISSQKSRIQFGEWWEKEWERINASIGRMENNVSAVNCLQQMQKRYDELLGQGFGSLSAMSESRREILFDAAKANDSLAEETNSKWRREIHEEVMLLVERISEELAVDLKSELSLRADKMDELLWKCANVSSWLQRVQQAHKRLEAGLQALLLRFARPVVDALILHPFATTPRMELLKRLGPDVEMIDGFYKGSHEEYKQLMLVAIYGRYLMTDPKLRKDILDLEGILEGMAQESYEQRPAQSNELIYKEILSDLSALEVYLRDSVFHGAGFASFIEQEIKRLRDEFIRSKIVWAGLIQEAYYSEDARLVDVLPEHLLIKAVDTEISERLRQLRLALEEF